MISLPWFMQPQRWLRWSWGHHDRADKYLWPVLTYRRLPGNVQWRWLFWTRELTFELNFKEAISPEEEEDLKRSLDEFLRQPVQYDWKQIAVNLSSKPEKIDVRKTDR